jgi:hypothetical protein
MEIDKWIAEIGRSPSVEIALKEGIALAERLNQERLGGQGKIVDVRKSIEGEDYTIVMEVPLEIYRDLDFTTEVGVEMMKFGDEIGFPLFLYFVPPGYYDNMISDPNAGKGGS